MKFTSAAILAASASTATALTNTFSNSTLDGGCGACKQFTINVARGASDGSKAYSRDAILANGTIPGPALNLKVGECVDFTVNNNMGDTTGIHFHGIRQLATPWSDGTPGLSQKGIASGDSYTYRWLADEPGTYFYHAHYKSQMMDGLYGAIVISAADGAAKPYTSLGDLATLEAAEAKLETVFTSDWNIFTAAQFLDNENNANIDDACTDSIVLNGYGSNFCLTQDQITANQRPQVPFILAPNTTLTAKGCIPASNGLIQGNYTRNLAALPSTAYDTCTPYTGGQYVHTVDPADGWAAMSFISPSGFTLLVATIDGHKLYVYAINGAYIVPQVVDQIQITPGDRISFFVKLDQPAADYTIRVANEGLNQVISGYGTLSYKGSSGPGSAAAIMNIGGVSPPNSTVVALDEAHAVPFAAPLMSSTADRTFVLDIMKNPGASESWQWVLNGVSPYSQDNDDQTPFLFAGPAAVPDSDLVLRTMHNEWVDLIIKVAGPLAQPHPIHKHANKFYVIGSGIGDFNYTTTADAIAGGMPINLANPPYLDGFTSSPAQGSGTWMVFRYQANTPGAWFMHCHIQTHFAGGMAVAILDAVDQWPMVPSNPGHLNGVCAANNTGNGTVTNPSTGSNTTLPIGGGNGTIGGGSGSATTTGSGSGSGTTITLGSGAGTPTTITLGTNSVSGTTITLGTGTPNGTTITLGTDSVSGTTITLGTGSDSGTTITLGTGSGSGTTTTSTSGSGATTTSASGSGTTSSSQPWGGWGDWTAPADSGATNVPWTTGNRPSTPTGVNGGDINYDGSDWDIWRSIASKASSLAKNGGVATTVYGASGENDNGGWGNWDVPATSTKTSTKTKSGKPSDPTATDSWGSWDPSSTASSATDSWGSWDPASTGSSDSDSWGSWDPASSVKATGTAKTTGSSASWGSWDPANTASAASWSSWNGASSVKATGTAKTTGSSGSSTWVSWDPAATPAAASSGWSTWNGASSGSSSAVQSVDATSATWSTWVASSSATGVAGYSGSSNGIATYTGAASTIKAGGVMVGALFVGAAALLL